MKNHTRRSFLHNSLYAGTALWLPTSCFSKSNSSEQKDKKKKLGIALLGLGSYSTYQLAPALEMTKHCYLAGIITGSPNKIPDWQKKYDIPDKNVYSYDNMHEVANNDDIDVIYIVTPTGTCLLYTSDAADE